MWMYRRPSRRFVVTRVWSRKQLISPTPAGGCGWQIRNWTWDTLNWCTDITSISIIGRCCRSLSWWGWHLIRAIRWTIIIRVVVALFGYVYIVWRHGLSLSLPLYSLYLSISSVYFSMYELQLISKGLPRVYECLTRTDKAIWSVDCGALAASLRSLLLWAWLFMICLHRTSLQGQSTIMPWRLRSSLITRQTKINSMHNSLPNIPILTSVGWPKI